MKTNHTKTAEDVRKKIKELQFQPTHFMIQRAAKHFIMDFIPEVTDYHLDSYVMQLYRRKEVSSTIWLGITTLGFAEDDIRPIHELVFQHIKKTELLAG